jgi:hypothetical protein
MFSSSAKTAALSGWWLSVGIKTEKNENYRHQVKIFETENR